jgi:hypothetical protein
MPDRIDQATTSVRRLDAAVAGLAAPGAPVDRAAATVSLRTEAAVRALRDAAMARAPEEWRPRATAAGAGVGRGLALVRDEPTGLAGAAIVFVLALLLTRLLWTPLAWPAGVVSSMVSRFTPTTCAMFGPANVVSDQACGFVLGSLTVLGAVLAMVGLVLVRIPLRRLLGAPFSLLPETLAFLGPPLIAALAFTAGWAGVQYHFPERNGIVTDATFPAVVGLLAYALVRYGPWLRSAVEPLMGWRDGLSSRQRIGVVILVPVLVSIAGTPIFRTPVRDQVSVIVAIVVAFLILAPPAVRGGDEPAP